MKIKLLALAAVIAMPAVVLAQEVTPEEVCCCCNKPESQGEGCCPEDMAGDDHAGHTAQPN